MTSSVRETPNPGSHKSLDRMAEVDEQEPLNAVSLTSEDEKELLKKIDRRIMPSLFAMIVLNYLDRNAFATARVQHMEKSLHLKGSQFNSAISIFFVGYIGLQIPSNLLITRVRPSIYLPACMIAWGFLSGMTAFTTGFKGLMIIRFLLGLAEAPYFPGALFFLSSWYTRNELAFRTAILYSGGLLSGAIGGLLGAVIEATLDGVMGVESWRWLFLIESSLTIFLAISALFILPDYPHTSLFLSAEEREFAVNRLIKAGTKDTTKSGLFHGLMLAIFDYKVWILVLIITTKTSASAVTSFIPTLVDNFGQSKILTLLMIAPPYVFAAATSLLISRLSDRFAARTVYIIIPMGIAILGFGLAALTMKTTARYISLFLMLSGVYGSYNVALAWISSTLPHPAEKRSSAIAIINTMGNVAQIYSPYLYLAENGPRYLSAMLANVSFCLACIVLALYLRSCLKRENQKLSIAEMYMNDEQSEENNDTFRYTL